jgi:hypothetical protein
MNFSGKHFGLDHAKLFDRPGRKPRVVLAAGGPERQGSRRKRATA